MLFNLLKQIVRPKTAEANANIPLRGDRRLDEQGVEKAASQLGNEGEFLAHSADRMLADSLKEKVEWIAENDPRPAAGALSAMWSQLPFGNKWHHYFPIYEKVLSPLRQTPVRILEIGVDHGSSLKLWRKYFNPKSLIVGIDIDPACAQYGDTANNIHVRIGSQSDPAFLKSLVEEFGEFDLIIDDGSHKSSDMLASFNFLFLSGLKPEGIYLVEDMHANYWPAWQDSEVSFMDVVKHLVDVMHHHYSANFFSFLLGDVRRKPVFTVPLLTTLIDEIRFYDSIVVIYKKLKLAPPVSEMARLPRAK